MQAQVIKMNPPNVEAPPAPPGEAAPSVEASATATKKNKPTETKSTRVSTSRGAKWLTAILLPLASFAVVLGIWSYIHNYAVPQIPGPITVWEHAVEVLAHPFYEKGPNDMGVGWQVMYSLGRVMAGFLLAALIGVPLGFLMGMSNNFHRALSPLIQILRPVSPLAWLPIGLLMFKAVNPSAIFVIVVTCIWPMILNTAAGVKAIPKDYMNVAAVLKLSKLELIRRILFPATLPYVVTGMRLSLGVAWMVIVAAEMLTGGIGIGFYVWDEWNNLNVSSIIVAIFLIGGVGIALDGLMNLIQRRFSYDER